MAYQCEYVFRYIILYAPHHVCVSGVDLSTAKNVRNLQNAMESDRMKPNFIASPEKMSFIYHTETTDNTVLLLRKTFVARLTTFINYYSASLIQRTDLSEMVFCTMESSLELGI